VKGSASLPNGSRSSTPATILEPPAGTGHTIARCGCSLRPHAMKGQEAGETAIAGKIGPQISTVGRDERAWYRPGRGAAHPLGVRHEMVGSALLGPRHRQTAWPRPRSHACGAAATPRPRRDARTPASSPHRMWLVGADFRFGKEAVARGEKGRPVAKSSAEWMKRLGPSADDRRGDLALNGEPSDPARKVVQKARRLAPHEPMMKRGV